MKTKKRIRKVYKPIYEGCNGRPQLWYCPELERLRIVYPNGKIECFMVNQWLSGEFNSRQTQEGAVRAQYEYVTRYFMLADKPDFLGYL